MNRIDTCFKELSLNNYKGLITFISGGDPTLDITEKLLLAMDNAKVDILEVGVPFSDPIAEGKTIQRSSSRAIKSGTSVDKLLNLISNIRNRIKAPIVFMMYTNTIYKYGIDKFFSECHRCGIDGIIIADLPIEEFDEFESIANNYNIYLIRIITPVSGKRIKKITNGAKGFLYCVSTNGVTGTRNSYTTDFNKFRKEYGRDAKIPTALGFGISTPEQVKELKEYADAIIIGSAIVNIIEEYKEECIPRVIKYIEEIKATLSN